MDLPRRWPPDYHNTAFAVNSGSLHVQFDYCIDYVVYLFSRSSDILFVSRFSGVFFYHTTSKFKLSESVRKLFVQKDQRIQSPIRSYP